MLAGLQSKTGSPYRQQLERDPLSYLSFFKNQMQSQSQIDRSQRNTEPLPEEEPGVVLFLGRRLKFVQHEETAIYQIQVLDMDADKVVRKIPSDEMLCFISRMRDLLGEKMDAYA